MRMCSPGVREDRAGLPVVAEPGRAAGSPVRLGPQLHLHQEAAFLRRHDQG
jgi:hypothetical protein